MEATVLLAVECGLVASHLDGPTVASVVSAHYGGLGEPGHTSLALVAHVDLVAMDQGKMHLSAHLSEQSAVVAKRHLVENNEVVRQEVVRHKDGAPGSIAAMLWCSIAAVGEVLSPCPQVLAVAGVGPAEPPKDLVDWPCVRPCGLGQVDGLGRVDGLGQADSLQGSLLDAHDQTALGAKLPLASER